MTISDEELRANLERRAGSADRIDLIGVARAVATTPRNRDAARRPRVVAVVSAAASVAVALSLAGSLLLRNEGSGPSSSASAAFGSPGVSAPPSPPLHAPAPMPWTELVWARSDPSAFTFSGNTYVQDGIADGDGFLAVGYTIDDGSVTGRIWQTTDGRSWDLLDGDWFADVQFDHILRLGSGLVIVGSHREPYVGSAPGRSRPAVWWSVGGLPWEERSPANAEGLEVEFAAAGPAGVLLYVSEVRGQRHWLRATPDFQWTRLDETWPDDFRIRGIAAGEHGWTATGAIGAGSSTTMRPGGTLGAIWTSEDGGTWSAATIDEPGGVINGVLHVGDHFLAFGSESSLNCEGCLGGLILRPSLTTWISSDGRDWRQATTFESGPGMRLGASVVVSGPRILGDGGPLLLFDTSENFQLTTRQTLDGETWTGIRNLHAMSDTPEEIAAMSGFEGPVIVGSTAVILFQYGPYDPTSSWPRPLLGSATVAAPELVATFPPNPLPTPNDYACPNNEPCGP
jgi:hypothetical protein